MAAAVAAGLVPAPDARSAPTPTLPQRVRDEQPQQPQAPQAEPEPEVQASSQLPAPALVVDRPLRSGQQVYARGRDLVVMAMVNPGAEVIADGSIHVYAPLRGRAIAGARGNAAARIYAACMEPQLVAVAGTYRTAEVALPDNVRGKPAQVRLDGERLVIEPLEF
jgi:septum site-determining protein MinC